MSRLRDLRKFKQAPYLVVGAGAQGLTFALSLALRGEPVLLVERSGVVGGQARSFRYDGFTFDLGLHAFVSQRPDVVGLVKGVLKQDFHQFYPRVASRLRTRGLIEDSSRWRVRTCLKSLYEILPGQAEQGWNCMAISKPSRIIYPRRGGFGGLFEKMARLFLGRGGRFLLNTPVGPEQFRIRENRIRAVRIQGEWISVRGCFWSAGSRLLAQDRISRSKSSPEFLFLYHFLVKGAHPVPYHWVRLYDGGDPFLPRLVYYPSRFSAFNAPRGHYGLGAAVPMAVPETVSRKDRMLLDWFCEEPRSFLPKIVAHLERAELLDSKGILQVFIERVPMPPSRSERSCSHPYEEVRNLWDSDGWLRDDVRESGAPLQMASALEAAADLFGK